MASVVRVTHKSVWPKHQDVNESGTLQLRLMAHKIEFRNRAREVTRVEAMSDVIFGFSISLLVVSLEAPKTYGQMMEMLRGFLPFAVCFWIFIDIWFEHHK